ncbi:Lsr2 family protein [Flexivirga sp. ID2601S]|uniref:Lsr2 family protein n=1 Tax=Flexivirga aerilata TaxID=1656889 RepID=A0A849AJZ5_9MICO|nr:MULTISPECIES: Lsr2 family protein [Flexivirga]NNG40679.1 Lsr2 family protein [Flexivirga aerilata]
MQRVQIILEDDIDGSPADETVQVGLDGRQYEIDLSAAHAAELRDNLAPFIQVARRSQTGRKTARPTRAVPTGVDNAAVRAWAKAHKIEVSPRGRIAQQVIDKYLAAGN